MNVQRILTGVGLLVAITAVYLVFLPQNHTEAEDTLTYIMGVASGDPAWHPNHLLFDQGHMAIVAAIHALGFDVPVLEIMQVTTVLFTIAMLAVAGQLTERPFGSAGWCASVALIAATFGVWHYGTEGEVYVPGILFVLLALLPLRAGVPRAKAAMLSGLWQAIAVLTHQMFFFLAVLIPVMLVLPGLGARDRWRAAIMMSLVSGGIVGLVYIGGHAASGSESDFIEWVKGNARNGLWDPLTWAAPIKSLIGIATALLSPNWVFALPISEADLTQFLGNRLLVEEQYLAQGWISDTSLVAILLGLVGAAAGGLGALVMAARRPAPQAPRLLDRLLLAHIVIYAFLATIWEPTNREFWIHVIVVFAIWLARRSDWRARATTTTWAMAAASLAIVNFLSAILPFSDRDSDFWYSVNAEVFAALEPGDLLLTDCGHICVNYFRFYTEAEVMSPKPPEPTQTPRRVILSSWALTPPPGVSRQLSAAMRRDFRNRIETTWGPLPDAPQASYEQTLWVSDGRGGWRPWPE